MNNNDKEDNAKTTNKKRKYVLERKVKIKTNRLLRWGWFKFFKCMLGVLIFSLGINLFIVPSNLYTGGLLGLAQLIRTALMSTFNINTNIDISSIIYYLINIPLLIYAYKKLSKSFVNRTLLTVTINSVFLALIPIPSEPLMKNTLANTLIGGILSGVGIGMVLSTGSSTGGTDIIGIILTKGNSKITVGSISLGFNTFIYGICGIIYGVEIMLYSIVYSVFESIIIDRNHTQNIKSQTFIFTKKNPEKIIKFINFDLKRGATYWKATGGYTNTNTYIVCTVLSKYERMRLERHMNEFDEDAFMAENDGIMVKGEFNKYLL